MPEDIYKKSLFSSPDNRFSVEYKWAVFLYDESRKWGALWVKDYQAK